MKSQQKRIELLTRPGISGSVNGKKAGVSDTNNNSSVVESREGEGDSNKVVYIKLTSIQLCAVKIQKLLEDHQDKLLCSDFEAAFVEKYNVPLLPGQYGYPSLNSLVQALPGMAYIPTTTNFIFHVQGKASGYGRIADFLPLPKVGHDFQKTTVNQKLGRFQIPGCHMKALSSLFP